MNWETVWYYNNTYKMDNSIAQDKRELLKNKFNGSKKAIESVLKQFKYQDGCSHADNMKKLCSCLENVMNVDSLYDFHKFLSNDEHLPIEINFKALKYEKLVQIFQDWLASKEDQGIHNLERAITHKHRNILFKRILIEQKETIQQYFSTLSQKKKLKGFDLFQLLTDLLGPYFLYQFNADAESFFEKVNSFQNFTKVVESFIKNGIRIFNKDRGDPNDESYIRFHQLEALLQFWELTNPELTIQQVPRKNMNDACIQTILINSVTSETQTDKQSPKIYLNVINRTLHDVNSLIQQQNDPQILKSLDKILNVLRSQKIFVTTYNSRKTQRKNYKAPILSSEYSQTQPLLLGKNSRMKAVSPAKNKSPNKLLNNTTLSNSSDIEEDSFKTIFRYLCSQDNLNCLTLDILHEFFCDLGLIQRRETYLVQKLINYGYIQDKDDVNLKEFKTILRQVMKEDKRLGSSTLKKYISVYIQGNQIRTTAYFKAAQPQKNQNLLTKDRERSFREESRTTYPIDSDGSGV